MGWTYVFTKGWSMIPDAPFPFVCFFLAGLGLMAFINKNRIGALRARAELGDAELKRRDSLLRDLRPTETAYSRLGSAVLFDRSMDLVRRLRTFYKEISENKIRDDGHDMLMRQQGWSHASIQDAQERRKLAWTMRFDKDFKSEAVLLRDEVLARLETLPPGGTWGPGPEYRIDVSMYGAIGHPYQIEQLANHLESIAKLLPVDSTTAS